MEWAGVQKDSSEPDIAVRPDIALNPIVPTQPDVPASPAVSELDRIRSAIRAIIHRNNTRGSRSAFLYMRILRELENTNQVRQLVDLKNIKHVGTQSYKRIEDELTKLTRTKTTTKQTHSTRNKYVPGFRTAPYAVLRALYTLRTAHKYLIALRAAPFTDSEFSESRRFSAFGAFKQLERKGLISSEPNGRYSLTLTGTNLAERLFQAEISSTNLQPDSIKLVIDSREKKSNKERTFFQSYFLEHGIDSCTRFLGLGDFLWIRNERILRHIVERKAGTDLIASLSDGRFREQKRRMRLFDLQSYLIAERVVAEDKSVVEDMLMEARTDGVVILETANTKESGWIISEIDRLVREEGVDVMGYGSFIEESINKKKGNVGEVLIRAIMGIKGMNRRWAEEIQGEYGTIARIIEECNREGGIERLGGTKLGGRLLGTKLAGKIAKMLK